ncbi:hypothetical protein EMIT0P176_70149 [Pseudomonas sp. IT-P176]
MSSKRCDKVGNCNGPGCRLSVADCVYYTGWAKCSGNHKIQRFFSDYVVTKGASVTEGYRQDSAVYEKWGVLQATVLLGFSGVDFFSGENCYCLHDKRALLREGVGGIM